MSYCIVHMQKMKAGALGGIQSHMYREHEARTNPDIDYTRSGLNYALIQPPGAKLRPAVDRAITAEVSRTVRSDAVVLCDFMVSASPEFFAGKSEEVMRRYFADSLAFFQERYGKQHVVFAQVHLDETTPHMHLGMVPVRDGSLSAKKIFTKTELKALQSDFAARVGSKYGLDRGRDGSTAKHLSELDYKLLERSKELEAVSATLAEYQQAGEQAAAVEVQSRNLPGNRALVDRDELADLVTKAQGFEAVRPQKAAIEAREAAVSSQLEAVRRRESDLCERSIGLDGREEAIEAREATIGPRLRQADAQAQNILLEAQKRLEEAEAVKNEQLFLDSLYRQAQEQVDGLAMTNFYLEMELRERDATIKAQEEEIDGLKAKLRDLTERVEALQATIHDLQAQLKAQAAQMTERAAKAVQNAVNEVVERASVVIRDVAQAVGMLTYSKDPAIQIEEPTRQQAGLVDGVAEYAAKWLQDEGQDEMAQEVAKTVRIAPEIEAHIPPEFPEVVNFKGGPQGRGFYDLQTQEFLGGLEIMQDLKNAGVRIRDPYGIMPGGSRSR